MTAMLARFRWASAAAFTKRSALLIPFHSCLATGHFSVQSANGSMQVLDVVLRVQGLVLALVLCSF
jgi:hypothetical protein